MSQPIGLSAFSSGLERPPVSPLEQSLDYATQLGNLLGEEAQKAMSAIEYITEHLRRDNQHRRIRDDWKYVAMVIDRLLLYVFFAVTAGGTMGILFSAPKVFEYVNQTAVIEQLKKSAEAEMIS